MLDGGAPRDLAQPLEDLLPVEEELVPDHGVAGVDDQAAPLVDPDRVGIGGVGGRRRSRGQASRIACSAVGCPMPCFARRASISSDELARGRRRLCASDPRRGSAGATRSGPQPTC